MKTFVKLLISSLCFALLLVCSACSSGGTGASTEPEPPKDLRTLHLDIAYETNLIFAKYDVDVKIDDNVIASIAQGDQLEQDESLEVGNHTIAFFEKGKDEALATSQFDLEEESYYRCSLKAHMSEIEIGDEAFGAVVLRGKQLSNEKAAAEAEAEEAAKAEEAAQKEKVEAEAQKQAEEAAKAEAEAKAAEEAAKAKAAEEAAKKEKAEAKAKAKAKLDKANLSPKRDALEYSSKTTDPLKLVVCDDKSVKVTTAGGIDLGKLGKQEVTFTLSADGQSVDRVITFVIRDTKKPKIKIANESVVIEVGEAYDAFTNIESIQDPVDGDLTLVDAQPESAGTKPGLEEFYKAGWFIVEGGFDNQTPGEYPIRILAQDRHGNEATRTFTVIVAAPQAEEVVETAGESTGITYVANRNTGKFHHPYCSSVDKIKPENRWDTDESRDELIAQGYVPCKICNP